MTLSDLGRGGAMADGAGGYALTHTILPPNSPSCAIGKTSPLEGVFSASSYHQGGCHVLLGDGAVLFITESIDCGSALRPSPRLSRMPEGLPIPSPYGLWGKLGTRASEETIGSDPF